MFTKNISSFVSYMSLLYRGLLHWMQWSTCLCWQNKSFMIV